MNQVCETVTVFRLWVVLLFLISIPAHASADGADHPDWDYVRKVLLTSETGEREGNIARWNRPARVAVLSKNLSNHRSLVRTVIGELNTTLAGTGISLSLVWKNPNILIQFEESALLRNAGADLGCVMVPNTVAYFCTWVRNENHAIIDLAVVVIQTDGTTGDFYSMVLEELTQVLGPANDVQDPAYEDSLFYEYEEAVSAPYFKVLSYRDRKLLQFLYTHLQPGDTEKEVRTAFDKYWDTITLPGHD